MTNSFKLPANIDHALTAELLFLDFPPMAEACEREWSFYVVAQSRGRCYYHIKTITVPVWAFSRNKTEAGYLLWYLAHEIAHSIAGPFAKHGPAFMLTLKRICPAHCIHYELGYKPRNAAAAGIAQPMIIPFDL